MSRRVVPQRCGCGCHLPTTSEDLLHSCVNCGRRHQARPWGDLLAWFPFDERKEKLDRYADALDLLRLIMEQHSESGPQQYIGVDELVPVLQRAEEGGSKPVQFSQNDLALHTVTKMLERFVQATESGSPEQLRKALDAYHMIFGDREFRIPESGTCPQCGQQLEAGLARSSSHLLRVFTCGVCGVPVTVDPDLPTPKPWLVRRWEKLADDEMKEQWKQWQEKSR